MPRLRAWNVTRSENHSFLPLRVYAWNLAFGCPKAHHHRECFAPCEQGPRATPHTCVSMENLNIWSRKVDESWSFRLFFHRNPDFLKFHISDPFLSFEYVLALILSSQIIPEYISLILWENLKIYFWPPGDVYMWRYCSPAETWR